MTDYLNQQWDRDYLLTFKNPLKGIVAQITGLRCVFECEMYVNNKEKTNKAKVKITNLSSETIDKLGFKYGSITLELGYKGNISKLFDGDVINIKTNKEGVDRVTEFELAPNFVDLAIKKVSYSFPENITLRDVVDGVADKLGLGKAVLAKKGDWEGFKLPYGFPAYGTGKQILDELARSFNIEWKIIDNVLIVTDRYGLTTDTKTKVLVLNQDSGMIGIPYVDSEDISKKIAEGVDSDNEEALYTPPSLKKDGTPRKRTKQKVRHYSVRVKALINPLVRPNNLFRIDTNLDGFDDFYRVRCVKFKGDTRGNDWEMELFGDVVSAITG